MRGEVVFEKHPAAADAGTGDAATLGAHAQLLGVNPEERCRFSQVERAH